MLGPDDANPSVDEIDLSAPSVSFRAVLAYYAEWQGIWIGSAGVDSDVKVPTAEEVRIADPEVIYS